MSGTYARFANDQLVMDLQVSEFWSLDDRERRRPGIPSLGAIVQSIMNCPAHVHRPIALKLVSGV